MVVQIPREIVVTAIVHRIVTSNERLLPPGCTTVAKLHEERNWQRNHDNLLSECYALAAVTDRSPYQPTYYGCRIREGDVMETGKSVARLRFVRELLGRTGREDEGEERDAGFTLIELMVVLLIMGILLAIAIPTFLSVTGGAKKTAAQSDLTNAYTSLQGVYSGHSGNLPTTKTTATALVNALHKTQTSITFKLTGTAVKGQNVVSVKQLGTSAVAMAAWDGAGYCWIIVFNEGQTATLPNGPLYAGLPATGTKPATKCTAGTYATVGTWAKGWTKITKPAT
jgi:type IV pilus assembly protein PilA